MAACASAVALTSPAMGISGVYEIVNLIDGRRYVGSTANASSRWSKHRLYLRRGTHHSRYLQNAWRKHGEASFSFRLLLVCSPEDLLFFEQRALDRLAPEYNVTRTAGSIRGVKRTPEFCAALGARKRGVSPSLETRAKIAAALRGKPATLSDEGRRRISETTRRRHVENPALSKRAQEKAVAALRGKQRPANIREKIGRALARLTDEQVREIRALAAQGVEQEVLVERFGISQTHVSQIVNRKKYRWVN